ncbi:MAG: extracellular solute-binding protein [Eubacteriales bacterium]|nr:extracellular solute-binding protein [Eubacteriales bacterium]
MKKRIAALMMAGIMVLGNSSIAFAEETSSGEGSRKISILTWSESECQIYAESFNKIYPDIEVEIILADNGDVYSKLVSMASAGEQMPDLAYVEMNTRGQHLALDIWEDLSQEPYGFDGSALEDSLSQVIRDQDGRVCIVEQNYNPAGMLYRRSLAEQYLGTSDMEEIMEMIPDWDAFCEVGAKIYEESGGSVRALPGLDEINWMIDSQYTDNVYDAESNTLYLTDYFTYMFDIMTKLRDNNCVGKVNRWSTDWNASYNNGTVVFWQFAPWSATGAVKPNAEELSGDFSVIKAPGGAYYLGGTGWGMLADGANKEDAWLFMEHCLLSEEGVEEAMDEMEMLTPLKGYYESHPDATSEDEFFNGQNVNKYLLEEVASDMTLRAPSAYDGSIKTVTATVMGMIQDDEGMTCEDAVAAAMDEITMLLPGDVTVE